MSNMGHSVPSPEEDQDQPEMKEQRRKNISTVLQRLSDKQSSGYESEREGELYAQTPTEPGVPSIDEDDGCSELPEHGQDIMKTVHTYTEYEQVFVKESSKGKQEGWMKYEQQEFIQQSSLSSSSHSVCYPKPLSSSSAFHVPSESEHKQRKAETVKQSYDDHSKANPMSQREPVIVPRHQSPFYRPHLWKSPTEMVAGHRYQPQTIDQDVKLEDVTETSGKQSFESLGQSSSLQSHPRNIELFPPPECIMPPSSASDKTDVPDGLQKKDPYPKNYKKYLQERYLSSLKEPEAKKAMPERSSSVDLPKKRLDDIKSESDRKNPSFSSTDSEGREVAMHSEVFIHVRDADDSGKRDEEEGAENKDDVFETSDYLHHERQKHSNPHRIHRGPGEEPLDLTSKQQMHPQAAFTSRERSGEEMRSPAPFPPQLSPSMYHHSPPMFYSPQHEMVSPRSPLWSVPEGRVFNFNLPSPFEPRCHSDPEFLSPGFSPDSPGLHFTFPPRSPYLGSGGEHSRMPKSPRLVYPGSPSRFPSSSNRPLPKLFCSPPQVSDFIRPPDGSSTQGSELTYICPVCGQVFPSYDNLAKHMAKHLPTETIKTADNNKVHYCKVCNRAFSRSDMLTRHMRLHTGLKPYECRVCGQVFSRSDHLNTHQRTHTGEKPYRCPQCPYAACRRDMITRHMRIHQKRSSKRGKYLSVPEGESADVRKSSVSSTDTTDSQEHSGRTCSVSSVDSVESESGTRKCSATSGDSFEMEGVPPSIGSRLWSSTSAESTDFEENPQFRQTSSAFYVDSPGPFLEPNYSYRKPRNWSTTSFESIDSEGSSSRRDSVADDFGELGMKDPIETSSSRDTPVIDDDSLRKFTISSDDIQN